MSSYNKFREADILGYLHVKDNTDTEIAAEITCEGNITSEGQIKYKYIPYTIVTDNSTIEETPDSQTFCLSGTTPYTITFPASVNNGTELYLFSENIENVTLVFPGGSSTTFLVETSPGTFSDQTTLTIHRYGRYYMIYNEDEWVISYYSELISNLETSLSTVEGDITALETALTSLTTLVNTKANDNAVVHLAGTETITGNKTISGNFIANGNTISPTELGYIDGLTSNCQTQINALKPTATILSASAGISASTPPGTTIQLSSNTTPGQVVGLPNPPTYGVGTYYFILNYSAVSWTLNITGGASILFLIDSAGNRNSGVSSTTIPFGSAAHVYYQGNWFMSCNTGLQFPWLGRSNIFTNNNTFTSNVILPVAPTANAVTSSMILNSASLGWFNIGNLNFSSGATYGTMINVQCGKSYGAVVKILIIFTGGAVSGYYWQEGDNGLIITGVVVSGSSSPLTINVQNTTEYLIGNVWCTGPNLVSFIPNNVYLGTSTPSGTALTNKISLWGPLTINSNITVNSQTVTTTELAYVAGATSNIQTQINAKAADNAVVHLAGNETITGNKTISGNFIANGNTISPTELGYIDGLTSNCQTQITYVTPIVQANNNSFTLSATTPSGSTILLSKLTGTPTMTLSSPSFNAWYHVQNPGVVAWTISGGTFNSFTPANVSQITSSISLSPGSTTVLHYDGTFWNVLFNTLYQFPLLGTNNTLSGNNTFTGNVILPVAPTANAVTSSMILNSASLGWFNIGNLNFSSGATYGTMISVQCGKAFGAIVKILILFTGGAVSGYYWQEGDNAQIITGVVISGSSSPITINVQNTTEYLIGNVWCTGPNLVSFVPNNVYLGTSTPSGTALTNKISLWGPLTINSNITVNSQTVTTTELAYVAGATSNIQTQINAKAADNAVVHLAGNETITGNKTISGNLIANGNTVSPTELGYVAGAGSNLQTQINTLSAIIVNWGYVTLNYTGGSSYTASASNRYASFSRTSAGVLTITTTISYSSALLIGQITLLGGGAGFSAGITLQDISGTLAILTSIGAGAGLPSDFSFCLLFA